MVFQCIIFFLNFGGKSRFSRFLQFRVSVFAFKNHSFFQGLPIYSISLRPDSDVPASFQNTVADLHAPSEIAHVSTCARNGIDHPFLFRLTVIYTCVFFKRH